MGIIAGIAAIIGAGISLYNVFASNVAQNQATAQSQDANALQYQTASLETGVQIDQTKSNISAYEDYLAAFPNYAELQKGNFEAEAKNQFNSLLGNFTAANESRAGVNVAAAASGRVGGSVGMIGAEAEQKTVQADDALKVYAGNDRVLGGTEGGLYQRAKDELWGNLDTTYKQYQGQLDIYKTSLGTLQQTKTLYDSAAQKATDLAAASRHAAETWWNPFD